MKIKFTTEQSSRRIANVESNHAGGIKFTLEHKIILAPWAYVEIPLGMSVTIDDGYSLGSSFDMICSRVICEVKCSCNEHRGEVVAIINNMSDNFITIDAGRCIGTMHVFRADGYESIEVDDNTYYCNSEEIDEIDEIYDDYVVSD